MVATYEGWQALLAAAFLPSHSGPTVLFVDDSELTRLSPESEDAAESLSAAVRSKLRLGNFRSVFSPILRTYRDWRLGSQEEPPPTLPLIALTVLAATRMRADAGARSTNYYLRLAQVILPGSSEAQIEGLRNELASGECFLDAVEMWKGLDDWINKQDGKVGVSTIRSHSRLQRIGYPISQALLRRSDQESLTRLFKALDLGSTPIPESKAILTALDAWTSTDRNKLGDTAMRALEDPQLRPILAAAVEAHAAAWDGRVLTKEGKQKINIRVSVDLESWQAHWLFPIPPNGPESFCLVSTDDEREIQFNRDARQPRYYTVREPPALRSDLVRNGILLRGEEISAEFSSSPVLFFRQDPLTGAWSSCSSILPFEDHLVLVCNEYESVFAHALESVGAHTSKRVFQRLSPLIQGYAIFQDVRLSSQQAVSSLLSIFPNPSSASGGSEADFRPRLVNGLAIATSISPSCYLVGGEPDLELPSVPRPVTVSLDGRRQHLPARDSPLRIELRRFITVPGHHELEVDGQRLSFTTIEQEPSLAEPKGMSTLGWNSDGRPTDQSHEFVVIGARVVDATAHELIFARRKQDESWLLHLGGRLERLVETSPPMLFSTFSPEMFTQFFEIRATPSARWLAQRSRGTWRLTEVGPARPREYDLDIDVLDAWKRASIDANGLSLWTIQLRLSRRVA